MLRLSDVIVTDFFFVAERMTAVESPHWNLTCGIEIDPYRLDECWKHVILVVAVIEKTPRMSLQDCTLPVLLDLN